MNTIPRLYIVAVGLVIFNLSAATLYVSLQSTNPVAPYATWQTAANVIQDAVDAAKDGDMVLVGDGVYVVGDRDANRVTVTNAIRLESVNGPMATTIDGGGKVRCVHLGANALLSGFTLTNGSAPSGEGGGILLCGSSVATNCTLNSNSAGHAGGGAYGGILYHCTVTGNSAAWGGGTSDCHLYGCSVVSNYANALGEPAGGGAVWCTLRNCTVKDNSAASDRSDGGGAALCTLYNCTVTGNSARSGGGVDWSTLYNCTLTGNSAQGGGGSSWCTLYNCTVVANSAELGGGAVNSYLLNSIVCYNSGGNYAFGGGLWGDVLGEAIVRGCCTTPLPLDGVANIEEPPLFMDLAGGDFRLREGSPCIDTGTNLVGFTLSFPIASTISYSHDPTDILGNARGVDGNGDGKGGWDIGAYEYGSFKPPRFAPLFQATPGGFQLSMSGEPGRPVTIDRSSDLVNWTPWIVVSGSSKTVPYMDPTPGLQMFYRAVVK